MLGRYHLLGAHGTERVQARPANSSAPLHTSLAMPERPSCSTPPPANAEEEDGASSSSSPDASYTSPTPRLRKQLQQCRTALSLAEGRTLASTRGAAQSKMELEEMTRKQRCSQVHIAALRDEVRTAERDATAAAAARDEAHGKLGTSSEATRLALGRFRERLGQLEADMAQRSARNQKHLQQLALLVAELQHEVGGRGGPAAAPPRTRSLLRQMQQCLSFAAQDAALPAAAARTHAAGDAIGSARVPEGAATQASPHRRQASPPRASRQASPPRHSGHASPQHRSRQASTPLRSRSAPVSSPSRRHASPPARAKLLSRLSAEGRPQRAAAAPTASQVDLAAATTLTLTLTLPRTKFSGGPHRSHRGRRRSHVPGSGPPRAAARGHRAAERRALGGARGGGERGGIGVGVGGRQGRGRGRGGVCSLRRGGGGRTEAEGGGGRGGELAGGPRAGGGAGGAARGGRAGGAAAGASAGGRGARRTVPAAHHAAAGGAGGEGGGGAPPASGGAVRGRLPPCAW